MGWRRAAGAGSSIPSELRRVGGFSGRERRQGGCRELSSEQVTRVQVSSGVRRLRRPCQASWLRPCPFSRHAVARRAGGLRPFVQPASAAGFLALADLGAGRLAAISRSSKAVWLVKDAGLYRPTFACKRGCKCLRNQVHRTLPAVARGWFGNPARLPRGSSGQMPAGAGTVHAGVLPDVAVRPPRSYRFHPEH